MSKRISNNGNNGYRDMSGSGRMRNTYGDEGAYRRRPQQRRIGTEEDRSSSAGTRPQQKRVITEEEHRRRVARARAAEQKRRKKRNRTILIVVIIAVIIAAAVVVFALPKGGSGSGSGQGSAGADMSASAAKADEETTEETTTEPPVKEVELIAAGDVIAHGAIIESSTTENGYDFTGLFAPLKGDISKADIAVVNMETPFGGDESGPYIGYPSFNTPDEMGDAIIDAGFDVVQLASNHSMDTGVSGLQHEIGYWDQHKNEITTTGLNATEEERNTIPIVEKEGIKIAFLNYTYGLNGYEIPAENWYMLTLLTDDNRDFIKSQIEQAKEEADIVVVLPHWGTEYQVGEPDDFQTGWAEFFTEAGADIIIGTHPHVIEKADWIEAGGNKALCYYSLGNYVSNQQYTDTVLGVMAYVKIISDEKGIYVDEDSAKVIPIVTHNDKTQSPAVITTYYLADYTDEQAAVHDTLLSYEADFSVDKMQGIIDNVFGGKWTKDRV